MNIWSDKTASRNLSSERNYLARMNEFQDSVEEQSNTILDQENEVTLVVEEKPSIGRHGNNIDDSVKQACAILSAHDVPQTEIAKLFGISDSSVSNFANGMDNNRTPVPVLQDGIQSEREKIERSALEKTMMTLGLIEAEDVLMLGAKDKSIVAQNLSKVAANMQSKQITNDNRIQMVIHAPQVRQDHHYQEIEVNS
jgi:predicted transcriptional regulator